MRFPRWSPSRSWMAVRPISTGSWRSRPDHERLGERGAGGARTRPGRATGRAGGGVRLFELALDDARGVLEFEEFEAGRSRARRFLRDAAQREHWPAVPAPSASVRALIARAAAHQAGDRSPPRQFAEWRTRLSEVPPDTRTPGVLAREA